MVGVKMASALVMIVFMAVSLGGKWAAAEVHHVVGNDRGWDLPSDVAGWSSGRVFRVGDKLWFTYSAAQESIAEIKTKEEYESCDVSNPIKMFTDGLDSILLDGEGIRYFVSSKTENCKNGLKLHVDVVPKHTPENPKVSKSKGSALALAAPPTTPTPSSAPSRISASFALFFVGLGLCFMGF
ncbi:hypothetical protein Patl1_09813 [Pistacia atlantica]|uniref:Uncharacterized protein n=1 Tax=Pistacia atlantica TaxID=434234 RepID=A0ACC1A6H2_9ROSI|nr:hypothetical protein Patl1_09813 [Pistacia atlantica]